MSLEELITLFNLEKCSKSGAKFDYEKGTWFNHKYLQLADNTQLAEAYQKELLSKDIQVSLELVEKVVALMKERCNFPKDLWEQTSFFFESPKEFPEKDIKKRWKKGTHQLLTDLIPILENADIEGNPMATEEAVKTWCTENEYGLGKVMNPFRLAIVGQMKGPHMFDLTQLIGKEETLNRLKFALSILPKE